MRRYIDDIYAQDGSISGGDWKLSNISFSSPDGGTTVGVVGDMRIPEQTVRETGTGTAETSASLVAEYLFQVAWRDGAWIVDSVETRS
jgi:hypothetical protein